MAIKFSARKPTSLLCCKGKPPLMPKKKSSPEASSLIAAMEAGIAHIAKTDFGYHVHIGDRSSMPTNGSYALMINNLAISIARNAKGVINANDDMIVVGDVVIPTKEDFLLEALNTASP